MTPEQLAEEYASGFHKSMHDIVETSYLVGYTKGRESRQGSGMRWIKASDKPMPKNEKVFIRTQGMMGTGTFMNGALFGDVTKNGGFYTLTASDLSMVEWLDESTPSEVERLREENREMLEMLKRASATLISPKWREDYNTLIKKIETNG